MVPDLQSRYLSEDIPFGLVAIKGVATLLGMPTPAIDRVVIWAQRHLGREYVDPATGKLLDNEWVARSGAPQRCGAARAEDLLMFVPAGVLISNAAAVAAASAKSAGALDEVLSSAASLMGALSLGAAPTNKAAGGDAGDGETGEAEEADDFAAMCDAVVGRVASGSNAANGVGRGASPFAAALCQLRSGSFSALLRPPGSALDTVAE